VVEVSIDPDKSSATSLHRHYPAISSDHEVLSSRHSDTDTPRLNHSRASVHDLGHAYADKFSRDDHMDVDPPYPSRSPYDESVHPRELPNRTSSHNDAISRGHIPPTSHSRRREGLNAVLVPPRASAPVVAESVRARSRDGSPQPQYEPRQASTLPSSAPLPTLPPGKSQDIPSAEDHRHRGRRFDNKDHDREVGVHESDQITRLNVPVLGSFSYGVKKPNQGGGSKIPVDRKIRRTRRRYEANELCMRLYLMVTSLSSRRSSFSRMFAVLYSATSHSITLLAILRTTCSSVRSGTIATPGAQCIWPA
jgi:hypothetical protein